MTWEAVARQRLNDVLDAEQATSYQNAPLTVSLFQTAEHRPSDRVGAAISDPVGAGFSLGYAFAVLNFSAPVVGCVRPPMVELSQLDLGGKKGYDICTDCHGRGLDVVTHGKAVQTGAGSKKPKAAKRAAAHKGKAAAAAKKRRMADSSEGEEDEEDEEDEQEDEHEGEEEGEDSEMDEAEEEAANWGSAAGQQEAGIWTVKRPRKGGAHGRAILFGGLGGLDAAGGDL